MKLILPFYHLVRKTNAAYHLPFFPARKPESFLADIDFLLESGYKPIGIEELLHASEDKRFHISFDDGLSECYSLVAPILVQKGIPASFFINTSFVDNRSLFYRYKAGLLIHKNPALQSSLIKMSFKEEKDLDTLAHRLEISFEDFLREESPYMSLEQIRSLHQQGFTIGSHSHRHYPYSALSFEEQIEETRISFEWLEEKVGIRRRYFSFPFSDGGVSTQFLRALHDPEKLHVSISFGTGGFKQEPFPGHFQRLSFEGGDKSAADLIRVAKWKQFIRTLMGRRSMKR